ncbi:MAG TPA: chromosomal replication initiator protein DnaA [Anaerolineales bacterium]|nr:chromosomal replication initiator protein DnaA [Anaerolineales bacterium]
MNAEQAWQATVGQLQMEMPKATFDTWVRDARFLRENSGKFTIGLQNAYARDWVESRLTSTISRILTGILNHPTQLDFIVTSPKTDPGRDGYPATSADSLETNVTNGTIINRVSNPTLAPKYTFENFVVGTNNRLAHAASLAVSENPARAYNPLFVYGGVGLGKTHLLHAIGNACSVKGLQVLYVSSEEFTNDLINAIRNHTTQSFREKYRQTDVLLIDDIQFIAGKESTQEEFFHTFNTLHGQDKQIVLSSDRPPKAMNTLEERLRSRFEWGLTADIQPPDFETRMAILRFKAERTGRQVPDEILDGIARRMQSNIRELEGALTRIIAYSDLRGVPLNAELVNTALGDMLPRQQKVEPGQIIASVAYSFGISKEQLLGRERTRQIALPRQVAMYLLREEANFSLPQIGDAIGGRDHTTVMYACEKIADLLERDHRLRRQVVDIREQLYGQTRSLAV